MFAIKPASKTSVTCQQNSKHDVSCSQHLLINRYNCFAYILINHSNNMKFIQLSLILPTYLLGFACVANAGRLGYSHHLISADARPAGHHPTTSTVFGRKLSEDDADDEDAKDVESEDDKDADAANEMMATASMSIFALLGENEDLSILKKAVEAAELDEALASDGPFTVFAPRDKAFEDVDVEALVSNTEALQNILLYHVLEGAVYSDELPAPGNEVTVKTANKAMDEIVIEVKDNGKVKINEAKVKEVDIEASNGVFHIIDEVLIPPIVSGTEAASTAVDDMKESDEKESEGGEDEKEGDEEEDAKGDDKEEEEVEKSKD